MLELILLLVGINALRIIANYTQYKGLDERLCKLEKKMEEKENEG